jgi:hypothetical protein
MPSSKHVVDCPNQGLDLYSYQREQLLEEEWCQEPYYKIADTEVLNHKLGVYIAVPAADCRVQLTK